MAASPDVPSPEEDLAAARQNAGAGLTIEPLMDLPREDELRATYRSATDHQLIDLALTYDSLTEIAQRTLRAEFERRGLEPPEVPEATATPDLSRVVTVQQYRDLADAQLAKGVLESAGIPCYLRDENTVRTQWLWSNLMGGVRLQVREEDREPQRRLCYRNPSLEQIQTGDEIPYDQPRCPRCGSLDIDTQPVDERMVRTPMPSSELPVSFPARGWRCESCGALWVDLPDIPQN